MSKKGNLSSTSKIRFGLLGAFLAVSWSRLALACAACYGQSDEPLAHGMNWGILSLLGVIGFVLMGVTGFFVYIARRSTPASGATAEPTSKA